VAFILVFLMVEDKSDLAEVAPETSRGLHYSREWKNLNYAGDTLQSHMLDIYLPAAKKESYPVVILIYGSAWWSDDLKGNDMKTIGKTLLDSGFAVVTPNHRSSKTFKFPAQLHDIKAAIRFIKANADIYQLDTCFIAVTGTSSGGHLVCTRRHNRCIETIPGEFNEHGYGWRNRKLYGIQPQCECSGRLVWTN
jgi:acetyl esterase/lipase